MNKFSINVQIMMKFVRGRWFYWLFYGENTNRRRTEPLSPPTPNPGAATAFCPPGPARGRWRKNYSRGRVPIAIGRTSRRPTAAPFQNPLKLLKPPSILILPTLIHLQHHIPFSLIIFRIAKTVAHFMYFALVAFAVTGAELADGHAAVLAAEKDL